MQATLPPYFWPAGTGTEPSTPPPADRQVLGHDGTTYLVVLANGSVASVDSAFPRSHRFVNSSVPQFVKSLEALAQRRAQLERGGHDEAVAISALRHDLNQRDIAALGDRDNWWAVILDHLEDSLP